MIGNENPISGGVVMQRYALYTNNAGQVSMLLTYFVSRDSIEDLTPNTRLIAERLSYVSDFTVYVDVAYTIKPVDGDCFEVKLKPYTKYDVVVL